ncbi:MAG: hypothetical protein JWM80_1742 [Cyanobacteria bacterium RYN_339]|nr:hypothetical protein [Cyanobacteria bacterium RYN_339]
MPSHICPLCGSATIQTAKGTAVCSHCETSVKTLNMVTLITPRPSVR